MIEYGRYPAALTPAERRRWVAFGQALAVDPPTTSRASARQQAAVLAQVRRAAAPALRQLTAQSLHRADARLIHTTLAASVQAERQGERRHQRLVRVLLGLVGVRTRLGCALHQASRTLAATERQLCGEDLHFLAILTDMLWLIDHRKEFCWQAKHGGRRLFAPQDKAFFHAYLDQLHHHSSLVGAMEQLADSGKLAGSAHLDISRQAGAVASLLLQTTAQAKPMYSPQALCTLTRRLSGLNAPLAKDPAHAALPADRLHLAELALAAKVELKLAPLRPLARQGLVPLRVAQTLAAADQLTDVLGASLGEVGRADCAQIGDLTFCHDQKHMLSRGLAQRSWWERATTWVIGTPFLHSAIVAEEGKVGHVVGTYVLEPATWVMFVHSDVFRLDWRKLITPRASAALDAQLGSGWQAHVRARFQAQLAAQMADSERFVGIHNPMWRRWASTLRPHRSWWSPGTAADDFAGQKHFCSEFVGKVIQQTLGQLEVDLTREFGPVGGSQRPPGDDRYLREVFQRNENFAAMHTGHLLRCLAPYGSFLPPPIALSRILRADELVSAAG